MPKIDFTEEENTSTVFDNVDMGVLLSLMINIIFGQYQAVNEKANIERQ